MTCCVIICGHFSGITIARAWHIEKYNHANLSPEGTTLRALLLTLAAAAFLSVTAHVASAAEPAASTQEASKPATEESKPAEPPKLDTGDTAWMLVSTGLVLFMVPGLALFYGGMVRRKNVLGTMMHSMVALAIIGIQWVLFGYSLAFGTSQGGIIGWSPEFLGLQNVMSNEIYYGTSIPIYVHCMYQGMFAIITPALISGAFAERIRFGPYCLFILVWSVLVYDPLAHWVWAVQHVAKDPEPVGLLGRMGARSISPAAPSFTSPPACRVWQRFWCFARDSAIPNMRFTPIAWC